MASAESVTAEPHLESAPPMDDRDDRTDEFTDEAITELDEGGIGWRETAVFALTSVRGNPLRSALTALGVMIGVAAVVALMAIGRGSQASITAAITSNGANLLTIRAGAANTGGVFGQVGQGQSLTAADAQALTDSQLAPSIANVSAEYNGNAQLVAGAVNANVRITGAEPSYAIVHNNSMAEGDFILNDQVLSASNVVVLGANIATTLFPDGSAVGQQIRVNGQSFQVVGVLASQGGTGFGSVDDGVIVPLTTAQRKLFGGRAVSGGQPLVSTIVVQAANQDVVNNALAEVEAILRERHSLPLDGSADDFSVLNQQDILNTVAATTQTLTFFLAAIAAISLLVGGIGIMNIMLVSVRERTREIGLRKALGAREEDILLQFLFEALVLSGLGGVIGLLLGAGIALLVNASGVMSTIIGLDAAILALVFALAVGLFFGIAPARSAARLDPITALRFE